MKFSIFVVTLNSGDGLINTINSVLSQQNADFEIIVKDGCSSDGRIEKLSKDERIKVVSQKDCGIYDAMNQAIQFATCDYGIFINCGDGFFNENTLNSVIEYIKNDVGDTSRILYYGDCFTVNRGYRLTYPNVFNDYVCFTKTLCHQATIYPISLLKSRPFSSEYKIAADFEYYVHAYKHGYQLKHIPLVIAKYQGNGASESTKNRRLGLLESKRALVDNFSAKDYRKIWFKTQLHGVGVKRFLVKQEWFYPTYCKLAEFFYNKNELQTRNIV